MRPSELKSLRVFLAAIGEEVASFRNVFKDRATAVTNQCVAEKESHKKEREKISHSIDELTNQKNQADKATETNQQRRHGEILVPQWITAVATVLAFIAASIYAAIAAKQLGEMHEASKAAREQLIETQNALGTNMSQFDRTMSQTIAQTSAQLKSAKAAIDAVNASRDQMRLDQRAWIGTSDINPGEFSEKTGFPVAVSFLNSGKTPATHIHVSVKYLISPTPLRGPSADLIKSLSYFSSSDIAPQGKLVQGFGWVFAAGKTYAPEEISGNQGIEAHYKQISDGSVSLYYFGTIRYDDIFGRHWNTNYCIFLADPQKKMFAYCDEFNDIH